MNTFERAGIAGRGSEGKSWSSAGMGALPGRLQRGGTHESTERHVSMAGRALTMLPQALLSTQVPADHCV